MEKSPRRPSRTTPAFAFAMVERALREGIARRAFGAKEAALVSAFFGEPLRCVYCDSLEVRRWDHLIPVADGGDTVVGNMVPSCGPCDDSKSKNPFAAWLRARAKRGAITSDAAEARIRHLQEYVEHFSYLPADLGANLSPELASQLADLRARLTVVRRDVEAFLTQVGSERPPAPGFRG